MTPAAGACGAATLPVVVSNERVQVLDGPLVVKPVGVLDRAPVGDRRRLFAVADKLAARLAMVSSETSQMAAYSLEAHRKRRLR